MARISAGRAAIWSSASAGGYSKLPPGRQLPPMRSANGSSRSPANVRPSRASSAASPATSAARPATLRSAAAS